ncbi:MAG: hypothetical protein ACLP2P_17205 [Desulfobaccales bacterium]
MQNMRKWMITRLGAAVGVAAGVLCLAMLTVGYATEPQVKGKAEEKPVQGQQLCPATTSGGVCQVKIECPPLKAPGQTTCKATVDCPEPHKAVKPKKKPKSE